MPLQGTGGEIYRFGPYELALATGELRKHGLRLKLQDQPIRLLVLLLENAGEIVSREQIQERLWASNVHVDYENAINSAVRKLREVLIDTSENPRYVETVARRGYRFIAPVSRVSTVVAEISAPEARWKRWRPWPFVVLVAFGAMGGAAFWLGKGSTEPPLQAVPLTAYPGIESSPSFSPDGNEVAFSWNGEKGDNDDIYVKLIGSEKPLRLTTDPARDLFPQWSPDGRSIAFVRVELERKRFAEGKSAILIIPALGGAEREVAQLGTDAQVNGWTPDGRWLLIAAGNALSLISVDSGERRPLTFPAGTVRDTLASLSPDGRTVAFSRSPGTGANTAFGLPGGDAYTLSLTSDLRPRGEPRRLTLKGAGIGGIAWTSDSREIVFSSALEGSNALWRMPVSGREKPRRLTIGENAGGGLAISPRSNRLAYVLRILPDSNIWRLDLSNPTSPPVSLIASTRLDYTPGYSPDGKRIAFTSDRSGNAEIWVCDADGSSATQLTFRGNSGSPRWSPDGRQIAFDSVINGAFQIFVMQSHGGQPRQMTSGSANIRPSWSHNGQRIYFSSTRTGRPEVWKMGADGGTAVQVTRSGGVNPVESEDGTRIYYRWNGLKEAAVDGSGETVVIQKLVDFAVARDGIYYHIPAPDNDLRFFSFAARNSRRIATLAVSNGSGISVSPNNPWLLFTQIDRQTGSELMLVENFH